MRKINYNDHNIQIITEKKKIFSKDVKRKQKTISIDEIALVRKELYHGEWNSITIITKDNHEEFIPAEELKEQEELKNLYEFLIAKRKEKQFEVRILEIETMHEMIV